MPRTSSTPSVFTRLLVVALTATGAMLILPREADAAKQAMYQDGNGGYYCDGTCPGEGCCADNKGMRDITWG